MIIIKKMATTNQLKDIASILRRDVLKITTTAGSGHPTTCLSSAEIISCLFFNEMFYNVKNALDLDNDEFILSKGHAAPILYSALKRSNCIDLDLNTLRQFNSPLEGHPLPSPLIPWVKVATGSLGQGLSVGVGMSIALKMQKRKSRVYVLLGDSECAEGSVYEALGLASHYKLNNLCALVDVNRLGQSGETMLGYNLQAYKKRFESFGWNSIVINGHNINKILNALKNARKETKKPTAIICKTVKGKGVQFLENREGWHGKTLNESELALALKEISNVEMPKIKIKFPSRTNFKMNKRRNYLETNYKINEEIATREAYGNALVKLAKINPFILATDSEVKNSTYAEKLKKAYPSKYIEAYIAEQNMIGMALGLSIKNYNVFASSFACFLSRAHDQIRMSALSSANITIVGSHAGISIGEDGPSQMGLEDISLFRALPNSIVLYPSDAVSAEKLVLLASNLGGMKYIRITRSKTKVIYKNSENFSLGDFKILKQSNEDKAVLVGSGITLHECLKAYERLIKHRINVAVVDLYCIKPFNSKKFIDFVKKSGNKLIVVEDHYKEGGIGEMLSLELVNKNLNFIHLCINKMPHSGNASYLLKDHGIDDYSITKTVMGLLEL